MAADSYADSMRNVTKPALLVIALLVALVAPSVASQAAAPPKDPPGIKGTKQYRALRTNVAALRAKANKPATPAQKATMRRALQARHTRAALKVRSLYAQRLDFVAYQSAKQLAGKVDRIERNLARELRQLNNQLDDRMGKLRTAKRNAMATTRARYADKAEDLVAQRKALRAKLKRTKNPVKRAALIERIDAIQAQINTLATEKQEALSAIAARYNTKIDVLEAKYDRLIATAKTEARESVQDARALIRSKQQARNAQAQRRRDSQLALVRDLYAKGLAYIEQMPAPAS